VNMDYLSCLLTVVSTILIGRKLRIGWIVAGVNSVVICYIAIKVHQYGFIPANMLCIGLYCANIRKWRTS
jgi:hypothetical protein